MSEYFRKPTEEWALHIEGNLGFAWSEERGEMHVVLLLKDSKHDSNWEKIRQNRRRSQQTRRAKRAVARPPCVRPAKAPRATTKTPADRAYRARKAEAQKAARARNRLAKAEKVARIMAEAV